MTIAYGVGGRDYISGNFANFGNYWFTEVGIMSCRKFNLDIDDNSIEKYYYILMIINLKMIEKGNGV